MNENPNSEQLEAIKEVEGESVLSAGAGSGKTFVIVEHLISYLKDQEHLVQNPDDQIHRLNIRKILAKIVLMTFTNKAAGELKSRIYQKLDELGEEKYFEILKEELNSIYIGTIHGFCFRLLRQGIFSSENPDIKIIPSSKQKILIKKNLLALSVKRLLKTLTKK